MLVLSRKQGERVLVGPDVIVTVLQIAGGRVKLGFSAPADVPIHREELRRQKPDEAAVGRPVPSCVTCG